MSGRQCGVTAKIHLYPRGKPTQAKASVGRAIPDNESSLGQVHLARQNRHPRIRGQLIEYNDCSGVTREGLIGERIHYPQALLHGRTLRRVRIAG